MLKRSLMLKLDEKISVNLSVDELFSTFERKEQLLVSFVNPFSYRLLLNYPELVDNINVFYSDGSLLQRLHNIFYPNNKVRRVSFDYSSIACDVFEKSQKLNLKVAFVGGRKDEIKKASENIKKYYPSLDIVYIRSGFFDEEEDKLSTYNSLNKLDVDILIAGMGTPIQEEFLLEVKKSCKNIMLMFTCGGFFTQTAIKADYYHPLIKKLGLRWVQRAFLHKHVRQRILSDYPLFLLSYIYEHMALLFIRK